MLLWWLYFVFCILYFGGSYSRLAAGRKAGIPVFEFAHGGKTRYK